MKKAVFGIVCCLFFVLYFKVLQVVYNRFVPMNTTTNVISVFIMIIILIPLAVLSAYGCEKIVKKLK